MNFSSNLSFSLFQYSLIVIPTPTNTPINIWRNRVPLPGSMYAYASDDTNVPSKKTPKLIVRTLLFFILNNNPKFFPQLFKFSKFSQHYNLDYSFTKGDSTYLKPFLQHNFRGSGKLLALRLGGKITGDSKRELSFVGKANIKRAINESMQWFDPKSNN